MSQLITIQAKLIKKTVNAIQVDCEGDIKWFPKSQIEFNPEKEELSIPQWLYAEKFPNEPI